MLLGIRPFYLGSCSPTTAKKLVEAGCNSIEDLRLPSFLPILSKKQRAKIKYMGHIEIPIEREDAEDVLVCLGNS